METQPENHNTEVSFRQIREAWLKGPNPNKRKKQQDAEGNSYQVTHTFRA
jgi:hypothetical protein